MSKEDNVVIIRENDIADLQKTLNFYFEEGYHISGGITIDDNYYLVVVVKPF